MKNKILFLGSLCLVLALGLVFIGCETEVPMVDHPDAEEISIRVSRAGTGEPTEKDKNNNFLIAWTAVENASFQVVFRPVGKVNYISLGYGSPFRKYALLDDKSDFDYITTTDALDNWALAVTGAAFTSLMPGTVAQVTGQFGVIVTPDRKDRNPITVWDDVEYRIEK